MITLFFMVILIPMRGITSIYLTAITAFFELLFTVLYFKYRSSSLSKVATKQLFQCLYYLFNGFILYSHLHIF